MATRRPKVPRANPAARPADPASDGGAVIRADFGGTRGASGVNGASASAGRADGGKPSPSSSSAGKRAAGAASGSGGTKGSGTKAKGTTGSTRVKGAAGKGATGKAAGKGVTGKAAGRGVIFKSAGRAAADSFGIRRNAEARPAGTEAGTASGTAGKASGTREGNGSAGDHGLDPVPAKAFSGRMLALTVVMVAITIMLAPTVKIFFDKRAEIAALEADIAAKEAEQDSLKRQVSRWQDPNYVKQQARDRINMVMPGETGYWVFGSDIKAGTDSGQTGVAAAQDPANLPWVDALWESIRRSATD